MSVSIQPFPTSSSTIVRLPTILVSKNAGTDIRGALPQIASPKKTAVDEQFQALMRKRIAFPQYRNR